MFGFILCKEVFAGCDLFCCFRKLELSSCPCVWISTRLTVTHPGHLPSAFLSVTSFSWSSVVARCIQQTVRVCTSAHLNKLKAGSCVKGAKEMTPEKHSDCVILSEESCWNDSSEGTGQPLEFSQNCDFQLEVLVFFSTGGWTLDKSSTTELHLPLSFYLVTSSHFWCPNLQTL